MESPRRVRRVREGEEAGPDLVSVVRHRLRDSGGSEPSQGPIYSVEFSEAEIVALRTGTVPESVKRVIDLVLTPAWERRRVVDPSVSRL